VEFLGAADPIPGEVERDNRSFGITDQGNHIPLYRLDAETSAFETYALTTDGKYTSFVHEGIQRNEPDQPYSTIYQYYRTDRSHHLIEIQDSSDCGQLVGGYMIGG